MKSVTICCTVLVHYCLVPVVGAAADACHQFEQQQYGVAVGGDHAKPYTVELPSIEECIKSCAPPKSCAAVVFKGQGVVGNPHCGGSNQTCCYRLSSCAPPSHHNLSKAWVSYVFPFRCQDDTDCSLAGHCDTTSGHCRCIAGFTGERCAQLDLAPRAAIAYTPLPNLTSQINTWCGSLMQDPAGLWHGFFTTMLNNCPVVYTFYQNGVVTHATAASPFGPFTNASVALPNWATQPEIHFDPSTSTYVLMHSRYDSVAKRTGGQQDAYPCDQDGRKAQPPLDPAEMEKNVSLAFSKSLFGPWECCEDVPLDSRMANPSMLVHKNGSVVLVWRGSKGLTTATAPDIHGPFTRAESPRTKTVVDPHIMWLEESSSYHVISVEGGHHFSTDAKTWQSASAAAFNLTVNYSNAVSKAYGTRECPKIVQQGVGGKPLYLTSVLQKKNSNNCGHCTSVTTTQQIGSAVQRPPT